MKTRHLAPLGFIQLLLHLLLHLFVEGGLQFYSIWWWLQVDGDVLGGILRKLGNCGGLVLFPEHGGVNVFLGLL